MQFSKGLWVIKKIKLVAMMGSGETPRYSVAQLGGKEHVGHAKVMVGAQLKKPLYLLVRLVDAEVEDDAWPGIMVSSHLGIEVPK